jgi:hypothetical protein
MPMPDRFVFDLDAEYPDVIIETMRRAVVQAIDDLRMHAGQLDGALLLCLTAFDFAETVLDSMVPLQQAVTAQQEQLTALTDRVAALEGPPSPIPSV